jgi:hypothetical protein
MPIWTEFGLRQINMRASTPRFALARGKTPAIEIVDVDHFPDC